MSLVNLARALLVVSASGLTSAQVPPRSTVPTPGCEAPVWRDHVTAFTRRIDAYVALRSRLQAELPPQAATQDSTEAEATRRALAERIRAARTRARQGDLLTPALSLEIKKSLRREIDAHTWKVIMDDNPGELPSQVNDDYRDGMPLSTMPPNILTALPKLPAGIEYRFVERHLILLDTTAMLILDRIPFAIAYSNREKSCR